MVGLMPGFRKALDSEMVKWEGYRKVLKKDERWAFDKTMKFFRAQASALGAVPKSNPLEAMFLSVLLEHQRKTKASKGE